MDSSRSGSLEDRSRNPWDSFWKRHGIKGIESWAKRRVKNIMSDYIRHGDKVLDAGCGTGFFSSYFISQGCDVYSLDYSEEALAIARRMTEGKSRMYVKADILNDGALSLIDRGFDIIFTDGLLEHYSKEEQDRIVQNIKRLKKDSGCMINLVPNRFSFWSLVRPFCMNIKERPFTMGEFLDLHRRNGLKVVSYGGINVLPFRLSPEKLLARQFGMLFYCIST